MPITNQNSLYNDTIVGELGSQVSTNPIDLRQYSVPNRTISKNILNQIRKQVNPKPMFYQSFGTDPVAEYFYDRAKVIFKEIMKAIIEKSQLLNGQKPIKSEEETINYNIIDATRLYVRKTLNGQNDDYEIPLYLRNIEKEKLSKLIEHTDLITEQLKNRNNQPIDMGLLEKVLMLTIDHPIFNDCLYKLNKHCYVSYHYEPDIITLVVYMRKYNQWMMTLMITIDTTNTKIATCSTLYDILRAYSVNNIIDPLDRKIWKEFIRLQKELDAVNHKIVMKSTCDAIMTAHMLTANYLNEKKDTLTENTTVIKATKQTRIYAPDVKQRVTSHIGPVHITTDSKKTIRKLSGIIKYTMPSWDVRGHYRHYKSGKVVYIPPHTNKRKNLEQTNDTIKRTIIVHSDDKTKETT